MYRRSRIRPNKYILLRIQNHFTLLTPIVNLFAHLSEWHCRNSGRNQMNLHLVMLQPTIHHKWTFHEADFALVRKQYVPTVYIRIPKQRTHIQCPKEHKQQVRTLLLHASQLNSILRVGEVSTLVVYLVKLNGSFARRKQVIFYFAGASFFWVFYMYQEIGN